MPVSPRPFRNAVVTGACGGLGQALVRELLAQGTQVALVGLQRPVLETLAATAPERCAVYTPDVADAAAMAQVAADWMARAGLPDLVIANAGVAGGFDTAETGDLAVMRRMLEINLLGPATTFQPFVQALRAHAVQGPRCALVGVASIAGWRGMPGNGAYCASKGGLIRYLESLRAECRGTRLSVHTVSPGYLRTALTAGNRFAMPGLMEPDAAARALLAGVARGREHIVLPRHIGWLSRLLACLPAATYDRLLRGQPRKPRVGEAGATAIPGLSGAADGATPAETR
ncbi:SDR family oxidoreductase [Acidovorax sp. Root217]|uniref:SDR family oxidoreductase n=1 Tax=Acidovorax sp. Root217 TaxID=1736492 RepID=UPI00070CF384|nr:SDR family oxidoreductase [Acidovorax sp. Root217]KRC29465.1 short-chain dehydrogenase [Acidovorax sp. Root217]